MAGVLPHALPIDSYVVWNPNAPDLNPVVPNPIIVVAISCAKLYLSNPVP